MAGTSFCANLLPPEPYTTGSTSLQSLGKGELGGGKNTPKLELED